MTMAAQFSLEHRQYPDANGGRRGPLPACTAVGATLRQVQRVMELLVVTPLCLITESLRQMAGHPDPRPVDHERPLRKPE
jgi:hypothetical protein